MPKQGQFAKSSRLKQLNQFRVKQHSQQNVIDDEHQLKAKEQKETK